MNNCVLNLSASVIATAQLLLHHNQCCIVSCLCDYCTLCLFMGYGWVAGGRSPLKTETHSHLFLCSVSWGIILPTLSVMYCWENPHIFHSPIFTNTVVYNKHDMKQNPVKSQSKNLFCCKIIETFLHLPFHVRPFQTKDKMSWNNNTSKQLSVTFRNPAGIHQCN